MIFVTVGTHEQQFDRLVRAVDELVADGTVTESVFIQTGYCDYTPKYAEWSKFISASEMRRRMKDADVVITHGGPSSFVEAMIVGKVPVVVPRRSKFGEHVNDHQKDFVQKVVKYKGGIIPVYNISDLASAIKNVRHLSSASEIRFVSHSKEFCESLEHLIEEL